MRSTSHSGDIHLIAQDSIALQLYTVRDALEADFDGTIRRIAEMGYRAVETASFPNTTPQAARDLFNSLGIRVTSAHSKLPLGEDRTEILETIEALGSPYLVCPWLDPDPYFSSLDEIKRTAEMLNEADQIVRDAGKTLAYHNHWFEAYIVDGKPAYQHLLDYLEPTIMLEIDTYWMKVGGLDPAQVVREAGQRAPLLHIKDGPATSIEANMVAVGDGAMDVSAILEASQSTWHIVELDRCDTDMLTAVETSYTYLKGLSS
jgi:sugar phosphate isomerase/epimerase